MNNILIHKYLKNVKILQYWDIFRFIDSKEKRRCFSTLINGNSLIDALPKIRETSGKIVCDVFKEQLGSI